MLSNNGLKLYAAIDGYANPTIPSKSDYANTSPFSLTISANSYFAILTPPTYAVSALI